MNEKKMEKEIIISTESGSDLPEVIVERYGFYVIPMHVIMDTKTYDDGKFSIEKVYEYYERTGKVPSTRAISEEEYEGFWNQIREEHPGCVILHFTYSSKASAAHAAAVIAVKKFQDVYVIDTLNVSGGCTAHMVSCHHLVQKWLEEGRTDHAKLAQECQELAKKAVCHFIPGTLEYLRAGGRVSNAKFLSATLLNLKPVIEIEDGKLVGRKKYRGSMGKIVDRFMDSFVQQYDLDRECIYLMYSKGLDEKVLDRMEQKARQLGFRNQEFVMTGCVISCHGGKGAMGIAGMQV